MDSATQNEQWLSMTFTWSYTEDTDKLYDSVFCGRTISNLE